MSSRRIGVYICQCGGNISDYVDVEKVREVVAGEDGVIAAKTAMFTCSDATQQEIVNDIRAEKLDGLVIASCSPKLHLLTFRDVAKRAGLNPYQYTQVNIREQCSWTHTDDREGATAKAAGLVRGGIARTKLTEPLHPIIIDTVPRALIIGAGIAGLRAAVGLSDLGISVVLAEKSSAVGGWVAGFKEMYPANKKGSSIIGRLADEVQKRDNITLYTSAELVEKSGSIGDFAIKLKVGEDLVQKQVGSIIVATGFDNYLPAEAEYGYGMDGVLTLPEFKELLDNSEGRPVLKGKEIRDVVYIYCVGSRQNTGDSPNRYCSRFCCNAAVHSSVTAAAKNPAIRQYHLFRDMRTYGKYEILYEEARHNGARFLNFDQNEQPKVERDRQGKIKVTTKDLLTYGEEIEIIADAVVLVTGMVPRKNEQLVDLLKLPLGQDNFFHEIHPKLRPVETVVDGIFISGACQGPKNSSESVASALAAVTQSASILKKGYVELEPLIACINPDLCSGCGDCVSGCPYGAIETNQPEGSTVVEINEALCKGCGGCAPLCPENAIDLKGYTGEQIKSVIDAFLKETG